MSCSWSSSAWPGFGRRTLLALLACCLGTLLWPASSMWAASAPKARDVRHDIEVTLDPQRHTLAGKDTLTLSAGPGPLVLSLARNAESIAVTLSGRKLSHSFDKGKLVLDLPAKLGVKELRLTVEYRIRYDAVPPDNPLSADDPSYGVVGTISDKGVFLIPEAGWYPRLPGPARSSRLAVTAPAPLLAVSEGRLTSQEIINPPRSKGAAIPAPSKASPKTPRGAATLSVYEVNHPQDGLSLVAGPFKPVETIARTAGGDVPVAAYFYPPTEPKDAELATSYLDAARGYIELYTGILGPYPFAKFDVVENFFPTGYGFASYTLLGSRVIRLPFITRTSLGHEIVHSWFGNSVLVDYSQGNWAEGVTVYLADYYLRERESASEARDYRLQILRGYAALLPDTSGSKDFPLAEFHGRMSPESQAIGYGKAAMVFHMARRKIGDNAFWAGLRDIVRQDTYHRISWDDFADAFTASQQSSPRADMRPFFEQWVNRPGGPRLSLEGVTTSRVSEGWQVSGTIKQHPPVYDLDLPVRVSAGSEAGETGRADFIVHTSAETTPFTLAVPFKPARIAGDPDVDVFRRLWPQEIPPTVNGVRGADDLVVVASETLDPDTLAASLPLPASLGRGTAAVLKESQATPRALAGRNILFLGLPRTPALLDFLTTDRGAGLDLHPDRFTLGRDTYASRDDALFAVLKRPSESADKVVALFLPLSPQAATACLRKIQHYGKYSFLVFGNGDNRAKGTWTSRSPLDIEL